MYGFGGSSPSYAPFPLYNYNRQHLDVFAMGIWSLVVPYWRSPTWMCSRQGSGPWGSPTSMCLRHSLKPSASIVTTSLWSSSSCCTSLLKLASTSWSLICSEGHTGLQVNTCMPHVAICCDPGMNERVLNVAIK